MPAYLSDPPLACGVGLSPLHMASGHGRYDVAALLLDSGADLERSADDGNTPLHMAAGGLRTSCVRLLLDRGARVEARNAAAESPLDAVFVAMVTPGYPRATESLVVEVARLLIEHGAK